MELDNFNKYIYKNNNDTKIISSLRLFHAIIIIIQAYLICYTLNIVFIYTL